MISRLWFSLCVLCALCGESSFAAPPAVESVAPGAGQRGTTFTLVIGGARLSDPQELMLYAPGVTCTKLEAKDENSVVATLTAAADARLGEYPFRLRTKGGASDLRTFRVTAFPVVAEAEPNDDPKAAQAVPLNTTVAGVIESGGTDHFAVTLKKGQRLAAEVEAVRLGVELTDAALAVFDPDGRELASVDDTPLFRQDPFVTLIAPTDGTYVVRVSDSNSGGGDNNRYLLHVGTFARPAAVFPAGGQAGTEVTVRLLGDAAGDRDVKLALPKDGAFELYPTDAGGTATTPNPFRVSPFPNVIEAEPNDTPKQAGAAAAWPVAFNGIVGKPGDADHFRFRARRGDVIDVSAWAYRIGSPLDPVVAVLDSAGALIASNDDDETHDSRLEVTIPADGEYLVRVTDKRGQGGPAFIYRVELAAPKPGLAVFLPERGRKGQDRHAVAVPRGNRVTAYIGVRRDGVEGPVTLTAGELPAGVRVGLKPVAAGEYLLPVVFEAAADAPLGGRLVELTGRCGAVAGGFAHEVALVRGPGDSTLHSVTLSKLAVVVVEEAPLSVSVVPPAAALTADGALDVTVRVRREKDFAEPVEVFFTGLPPGVEAPTSVVIPADKTEAVVTLVAGKDADPGEWPLVVEAAVARPGRANRDPLQVGMNGLGTGAPPPRPKRGRRSLEGLPPVASELRTVAVSAAPVKGAFAAAACEQGKTAKVVLTLDAPLTADFAAKLDGLPPRATAPAVEAKAGAKRIEFLVTADATTPPGEAGSLVCELAGTVGGQRVVYRVGRGGALKIDAPGAAKTGPDGKPLSPLDALRQEQKKP
jgi:hypothetical protein